ncbi:MAG: hypothetical protein WCO14_05485 [bacterium]
MPRRGGVIRRRNNSTIQIDKFHEGMSILKQPFRYQSLTRTIVIPHRLPPFRLNPF